MVGADPFLAARDPQQILVDGPVPLPVETVAGEGMVEGLPMQLFGLSQGTVDVEDQRGGAADQLGGVTWPYGGRFCLHDRCVPPDERPSPAQAGETNCNIFCRTQKSLMSGGRAAARTGNSDLQGRRMRLFILGLGYSARHFVHLFGGRFSHIAGT